MPLASAVWIVLVSLPVPDDRRPASVDRDPTDLGIPFERYVTRDQFDRPITLYLSRMRAGAMPKPLALMIGGSGCQSVFQKRGPMITGGLQNLLLQASEGRARVLIVEKPGVKFLDEAQRPGTALGASREFLEEHTLPRWTEANLAALAAARTLPGVDATKTLVVGHSEGGLVAASVASRDPAVTHVVSLAGGGPTQLFSLLELLRAGHTGKPAMDAAKADQELYAAWAQIQADPDSVSKFWLSHPYRRWSSFLKHSVTEELLRTKARIYLAQGTRDTSSPVTGFDVLRAELASRGKDVVADRVEGADHGFRKEGEKTPEGMTALMKRVVAWFLEDKK